MGAHTIRAGDAGRKTRHLFVVSLENWHGVGEDTHISDQTAEKMTRLALQIKFVLERNGLGRDFVIKYPGTNHLEWVARTIADTLFNANGDTVEKTDAQSALVPHLTWPAECGGRKIEDLLGMIHPGVVEEENTDDCPGAIIIILQRDIAEQYPLHFLQETKICHPHPHHYPIFEGSALWVDCRTGVRTILKSPRQAYLP